jgi:MFS family permease
MGGFRERAFVPVLVYVGLVVSVISSLGAPLIPTLARDLHASLTTTQWTLTAPPLVAAVASPLVGRLGDGRHRKGLILGCLVLVVLGGVLAALATGLTLLIAGRALQGFGLALMPLTMAAAREHLPPERSRSIIALLSVVAAAGVGLGYPITGLIAQHLDVSVAFWFGVAVSVVALVLSALVIPRSGPGSASHRIDVVGAAAIGAGLLALLIALEKGAEWGWGASSTLALLAAAVLLVATWAVWELRVDDPLVDLRLLRHRRVLTANVAGLTVGVAMYVTIVVVSQFVQLDGFGLGASVFVAGLTLVPLSLFSTLTSRTLPAIEARVGVRPIIPAGAVAVGLSCLFFAATADHLWQVFVTMGILGLGLGYTFAAMPGLIVGSIPRSETSSAMAFYQVSRFVGFSIGSGLAATLLHALGSGGEPTLSSYRWTALAAAGFAGAAAVIAWVLPGRSAAPGRPVPADRAMEEGILASSGLEMLEDEPVR